MQGLFGSVIDGTIKNITIEKGYIEGGELTGGLVGRVTTSNLDNIKNKSVTVKGTDYVGGIAGAFTEYKNNEKAVFKNCMNESNIEGNSYVGGICGYCITSTQYPGATVNASYHTMEVYNVGNNGKITGKQYVGGVIGSLYAFRSTIYYYNSFNSGDCIGENYIGGCMGRVDSSDGWGWPSGKAFVGNLYNAGSIQSTTGSESIGGIYGDATAQYYLYSDTAIEIQNCYSLNNPTGTKYTNMSSQFAGGPIRENNIVIKSSQELKSQELIDILNIQKEKDKIKYNMELKTWIEGNEQTKGYPKFEN